MEGQLVLRHALGDVGGARGARACSLSLVHKPTVPVSARWMDSADYICVSRAFNVTA